MLIWIVQVSESLESSSSDSDVIDDVPRNEPVKAKAGKKCRVKKVIAAFRDFFSPRPRFGMLADRVEPLPPSAPGTHTRWVNTVDGTISYYKAVAPVSMLGETAIKSRYQSHMTVTR